VGIKSILSAPSRNINPAHISLALSITLTSSSRLRRFKTHKQLPLSKAALAKRKALATSANQHLVQTAKAA
jgi:hypothetical protein